MPLLYVSCFLPFSMQWSSTWMPWIMEHSNRYGQQCRYRLSFRKWKGQVVRLLIPVYVGLCLSHRNKATYSDFIHCHSFQLFLLLVIPLLVSRWLVGSIRVQRLLTFSSMTSASSLFVNTFQGTFTIPSNSLRQNFEMNVKVWHIRHSKYFC